MLTSANVSRRTNGINIQKFYGLDQPVSPKPFPHSGQQPSLASSDEDRRFAIRVVPASSCFIVIFMLHTLSWEISVVRGGKNTKDVIV